MPKLIEGHFVVKGKRFAIAAARFNAFITEKLVAGAIDALTRHGVKDDNITLAWVPGAFELPLVTQKLANSGEYDAVIALGCVIRGSTSHYDYVCNEAAKGIAAAAANSGRPVIFGILTTDTIEQAIERAGTKHGNKGAEAAIAAIEMADLMGKL